MPLSGQRFAQAPTDKLSSTRNEDSHILSFPLQDRKHHKCWISRQAEKMTITGGKPRAPKSLIFESCRVVSPGSKAEGGIRTKFYEKVARIELLTKINVEITPILATLGGLLLIVVAENPAYEENGSGNHGDGNHYAHRRSHFFN
jgi:hypothetical protein